MKRHSLPVICLAAITLGAAIGIGSSLREFAHEQGIEAVPGSSGVSPAGGGEASPARRPKIIVVGSADFDFGVMERDETRRHTFRLKNIGDALATLTKGDTTCKCTLSELAQGRVAPGETVDVTLEWKPNSFADSFRQSANIETNDPANPLVKLEVHGRVIQTVRPVPEQIVLNSVSANEPRQAVVHVFCYREGEFNLQFDRCENESTAEFFQVEAEPLSQAAIDEEPAAQSGAKILVTLLPGLPLGPIQQKLHFSSNLVDLPELTIPIHATVVGDISILAGKELYNSDLRLLKLGGVPRETGGVFRMQLLIKGPHAATTEFSVGETDPADVLQVTIDTENPTTINDGAVLLYPMTVTIPPGSRPVSRLGGKEGNGRRFGKIVIHTTHPQAEKVLLLVKFAVQG